MREDLVSKIGNLYLSKEYEIQEDNALFIIKDVIYTINDEFLRDLYR